MFPHRRRFSQMKKFYWIQNHVDFTSLLVRIFDIWWSKSNFSIRVRTITLSPRCHNPRDLCEKGLYFCRTKTETDMTFTFLFFSDTMLLYPMWHRKEDRNAFKYSRLSSLIKSTSTLFRMKSTWRKHLLVEVLSQELDSWLFRWLRKGFMCLC